MIVPPFIKDIQNVIFGVCELGSQKALFFPAFAYVQVLPHVGQAVSHGRRRFIMKRWPCQTCTRRLIRNWMALARKPQLSLRE